MEEVRIGRMKLGSQGLEVSKQGLGCMGMAPRLPKPESETLELIHYAVRSGVTHLNTSDLYGSYNTDENLIGKAIRKGLGQNVELGTTFKLKTDYFNREIVCDPATYVKACCEASLKRVNVSCIDLYYQHQMSTRLPIEIMVGEMKKMVEEGKVKYIGLFDVCASTIRKAHAVHPLTAVQIDWSLWSRKAEEQIIPTCRELGIGIVAYNPMGKGFFFQEAQLVNNKSVTDSLKLENLEQNKKVEEMAIRKKCTPSQLALAWIHHQGNDVCPIPPAAKIPNIDENIVALSIKLTQEELAELEFIASQDLIRMELNRQNFLSIRKSLNRSLRSLHDTSQ